MDSVLYCGAGQCGGRLFVACTDASRSPDGPCPQSRSDHLRAVHAVFNSGSAVTSPWVATGCVAVAMAGYTGANVTLLAFTTDAFPKESVASVWGLASMGAGFGGMLFTLIAGWLIQHFSYTPVFVGFGIMPLICSTILWTLTGPLPEHRLPVATP